jgi:DNA-binding NtrC family response regulator
MSEVTGRILIVDDEENISDLLKRHFTFLGHEISTACNGTEAKEMLSESVYDLIISDIVMPEMNGVELLQHVREEYPMIRVIMMTGYVTLTNLLSCMANQADTVVFKPFEDLEEMEIAVNTSLKNIHNWKNKLKQLQGMKPSK